MKGLINLKNKDHKCFMWCHVRLINLTNSHPGRINEQDKKITANLSYLDIRLLINGCQVNYESGIIKFTNYNKQIPILFKIYADTECFLKRVNSYEGEHTTKYQEHIPNSIGAKLVCIDDRFTLPSIIFKGKHCINKFIL